ncbi:MAG: lipoate--protein ligase [Clostridiales bacterium]|nr:lipoate--protein ligase [Clostridiales bacterium]
MTGKLKLICSESTVPYYNLALEEYLLNNTAEGECILYLWQNRNTVVIGRNQNPWRECRCESLEADGGFLARRLSGGGTVYHDLGNLNFTFFANKADFDIPRQTDVILRAVNLLGIKAEKTGRNDITADGKKFSGNAYYETSRGRYHHGTIMVNVDREKLGRYLNTDAEKLKSKGVKSYRSRVCNLSEYREDITIDMTKEALREAFEENYGKKAERIFTEDIDLQTLKSLQEKYSSRKWLYGRKISFKNKAEKRFPWGGVQAEFNVEGGKISAAEIHSDSLYPDIIEKICFSLKGTEYRKREIEASVNSVKALNPAEEVILKDISRLLTENIL